MKPVNTLSNDELVGEFHAIGHLADRLKDEGYLRAAARMAARLSAVFSEMKRRANLN